MLKVKLHNDFAKAPRQATEGSAGYDLTTCEDAVIPAGEWTMINTGISIHVPPNTYGRVAPRSGLSLKGLDVLAGVIDESYRGIVKVVLINHGKEPYTIVMGDRIAQLIIEKIEQPEVMVVEELDETDRGEGGFGSTGVGQGLGPASRPSVV